MPASAWFSKALATEITRALRTSAAAQQAADGFFDTTIRRRLQLGKTCCEAALVTTRLDAFDVGLYRRHGIFLPDDVARSVPVRQADYLAGRLASRLALRDAGCAGDPTVPSGAHRQPVWPRGFLGSISHCANLAVALVTTDRQCDGIGVDVEGIAVKRIAVDDAEQRLCRLADGIGTGHRAITLAFSAKESFFKAAFGKAGRFFGFEAARVTQVDDGVLRLRLTAPLADSLPAGRLIDVHFGEIGTDRLLTATVL